MKRYYTEPELTVRNYLLNPSNMVLTISGDHNLNDGDDYTDSDDVSPASYFGE